MNEGSGADVPFKQFDWNLLGSSRIEYCVASGRRTVNFSSPGSSGELAERSGELAESSGELAEGSGDLPEGSGELAESSGELAESSGELAESSGDLPESSGALPESSGDLPEGFVKPREWAGVLHRIRRLVSDDSVELPAANG